MTRTTLSLFGTTRRPETTSDCNAISAAEMYRQERLAGLTPIEREILEARPIANPVAA